MLEVMSAKDKFHDIVRLALVKDGWSVTDDPYIIQFDRVRLYADLGAERPLAAQRGSEKIVVEVKSFVGASKIQDLKEALGQYDIYRYLLEEVEPERKLFVAISSAVYDSFFSQELAQLVLKKHGLPVIVVDIESEVIERWIS